MGGSPRPLASAPPSEAERLLALSIVLDGRLDEPGRLATARLAARLGFGVWWREPPLVGQPVTGTTAPLAAVVGAAHPVPAGLIADLASPSGAAALGALAAYAVGQPGAEHGPPGAGLRLALAGPPERVSAALTRLPAAGLFLAVDYRAVGPGRPVPPAATLLVTTRAAEDLSTAVAAAVATARRADPSGAQAQVLAEVPVSIGRTAAEAHARARPEEVFRRAGDPARHGLFGTLEECQHRAAELAHAGVTELACHLPYGPDTPDVLAQLRAVAVVGRRVLRPGAPPSPAPPPPAGWGGRRVAKADTG